MRKRSSSSSSYIGPRERRSGSNESNSGEERPHRRDSRSRSESSSSGSEGATPSVAAAASTTGPERFITELLQGQQEPVAFVGACPLHFVPFPSVIESLQQCIARGAAAAAAAAVAAHKPAAGAGAPTGTATMRAAAAAASASEYDSSFFEREGGPQADDQDPTHEVYVQEVWCSSLCGDDGKSWQQRLQQHFLRFLSDSAALRASARVLLLMRPDVWFERVAAPHTSSSGTCAAAGEAGKQKKRGATAAAQDNAAAIAALCEAGLQAGAATGDSDTSSECDAEVAETGAADTESPTSAVRGAAVSTEQHGSGFSASPSSSRRKQRHARGRRNAAGETEFVVRMLQWLQEALKLQQQLWGVRRHQRPETATIASGEAGERGGVQCMRGPAGPVLAVGVFERQLPKWSPYHKVFESWLLLPPPRCSFFPTEREFGQLASCQQEAVMKLQRLMQRERQQLHDAAVGALMAFADSRFSREEEEELLAIVEDHEQQQQQVRGQLQQRQEQQLQQREYPAASAVQQTHQGVSPHSKKSKRWHEAANALRWPTPHGEHAMLQREQQLLQEEEDEDKKEEEREPSVNREVFFPDHASVMLLPEEEQLIDTWKLLACRGGHGRKNSYVLQSDQCAAEDSSLPLCSRRAAASATRARAVQTAATSDLAAPPAGHAEPAAAGGRDLRAASSKEENASAAVAAADATAVSPSAAAPCRGFRSESGGHVGPAAGELPAVGGTDDIEGRSSSSSSSNHAAVGTGDIKGRSSSNNSARDDAAVAGAAAEAAPAAPTFTGLAPQPTAQSRAGRICPTLQLPGSPGLLCAPPFVVSLLLQQQQQQHQPCPRLLLPSFQGARLQCGGGSSAPLSDAFPPLLLRCACCRCAARREMTSGSYRRTPRDGRKASSGGDADEVDHRACGGRSSDCGAEGNDAESCCHLRDACCCRYCRDDLGSSATTSGEGFRSGGDGGRGTGESSRRRRERCTRCAAGRRACDSAAGRRRCESSMRCEGVDSQRSSRREGRSRRKASSRQKRGGSKVERERRGGVVSDCRCFCLYRRETFWRGLKAGEGRSFLICGPLGSGKSVLMRTLASALSISSSDSWWSSSSLDTEDVATSRRGLRKKTCGITNDNASDDRWYGSTGASCTSGGNSIRMKQRNSGCSGHSSGSERCDEMDEAPQSSSRQRGGVVFAHVGQLLHGEVGSSHRALVQLFSSAAAADAAICLECIDVAFGSAAGLGRQKELWIEEDVGGGSKGCRDRGNWAEREGDETQGLRRGYGGAPEKETSPSHGHESLADNDASNFEKGPEELFEDDDELQGHPDDPVAELQAELMQLFETLVDVFVRQGGVTLFCTVSTRPEFLPLQLLRCFSDTIRLSPMLSNSPEL